MISKTNYFVLFYLFLNFVKVLCLPLNEEKLEINIQANESLVNGVKPQLYRDFRAFMSPKCIFKTDRIKLCRSTHRGEFDETSLDADDQDELDQSDMNACRVDCVVYKRFGPTKRKFVFTEFFREGQPCGDGKVCKTYQGNRAVRVCA